MSDSRILLATDGSEPARSAETFIIETMDPDDVTVYVLFVLEELAKDFLKPSRWGIDFESFRERYRHRLPEAMRPTVEQLQRRGFTVEERVDTGQPGPVICDYARDSDVTQIVMGRRGRGEVREVLLGSVSQYVLHHAPCAVTIVPGRT